MKRHGVTFPAASRALLVAVTERISRSSLFFLHSDRLGTFLPTLRDFGLVVEIDDFGKAIETPTRPIHRNQRGQRPLGWAGT